MPGRRQEKLQWGRRGPQGGAGQSCGQGLRAASPSFHWPLIPNSYHLFLFLMSQAGGRIQEFTAEGTEMQNRASVNLVRKVEAGIMGAERGHLGKVSRRREVRAKDVP